MMKRGAKRPAFSDFSSDPSTSTLPSKRVMEAPSFGLHKAESFNQNLTAEPASLDQKRAESSHQHVRALNCQFASWVQSQLQNHPDELWEDGVRDYLSHASHIMEKFKDVVDWLKANSEKSKAVAKPGLFGDKELLFSEQEKNKATVQSEYGTVSTKLGPQSNSSFLTTSPQSSAAPFSVFQKPPSTSSSSEKESKATQQADVSNGFPKPPLPFNFSFSAAPNSGSSFSTQAQSSLTTGFSFSTAQSAGVQSSAPLFGSTYSFSGMQSGGTTTSNTEASAEDDEEEQKPSSPSVKKSEEIGVVVVHEAKCKVYIKPDNITEKGWKDMGVGHLSIKTKEGANKATKESKPTIVIRNDVGKILLNALIYSGIKTNIQKNTVATVFHTSDEAGTVVMRTYLLKLKNGEEAAKLADTIKENAPSD
ncbi:pleckstrin homology (PH) domain superfamily protein isoform X4 [Carex rostrata]